MRLQLILPQVVPMKIHRPTVCPYKDAMGGTLSFIRW